MTLLCWRGRPQDVRCTVVLVGGFRDCPSNIIGASAESIRTLRPSAGKIQDVMLLLTFPKGTFPAGAVMGWPEPPEGDMQEHATFSHQHQQHMCFGVPTQPVGMDARQVHRHTNLAKHPCTRALYCPHHAPPSVWRLSRQHGYFTSRPCYYTAGILVPHPARCDRYPLLWRGWADSSTPLRYLDIPHSSDLDPLRCLRMCTWEYDEDLVP